MSPSYQLFFCNTHFEFYSSKQKHNQSFCELFKFKVLNCYKRKSFNIFEQKYTELLYKVSVQFLHFTSSWPGNTPLALAESNFICTKINQKSNIIINQRRIKLDHSSYLWESLSFYVNLISRQKY